MFKALVQSYAWTLAIGVPIALAIWFLFQSRISSVWGRMAFSSILLGLLIAPGLWPGSGHNDGAVVPAIYLIVVLIPMLFEAGAAGWSGLSFILLFCVLPIFAVSLGLFLLRAIGYGVKRIWELIADRHESWPQSNSVDDRIQRRLDT